MAVVVPAYNEAHRILRTLERLREYLERQLYRWSVRVVSDGSTDGTDTLAPDFARGNPAFDVVAYTPNRGKGEELEKVLKHIDDAPIVIGSRGLPESWLERRQPFHRDRLGRLGNKLIRRLGVPGIYNTQCGFRLFRREAAREVFRRVKLAGYGFNFEGRALA